jgi:catechol 2,3-dioxygenase-like lactoylglutathione lyase family enzyme
MSHAPRFDHVGITVADLDTVKAFFAGLGLEVEGRTFVEGESSGVKWAGVSTRGWPA